MNRGCLLKDCGFVSGMEEEKVDPSLDLSQLTDEEQSTILQVLQRDSELRRLDEGRVRSEVTVNPSLGVQLLMKTYRISKGDKSSQVKECDIIVMT